MLINMQIRILLSTEDSSKLLEMFDDSPATIDHIHNTLQIGAEEFNPEYVEVINTESTLIYRSSLYD